MRKTEKREDRSKKIIRKIIEGKFSERQKKSQATFRLKVPVDGNTLIVQWLRLWLGAFTDRGAWVQSLDQGTKIL